MLASVVQLDASVSTATGSTAFFHGDLIMKVFSTVILSLLLIQEGQLSVSGQRRCMILVNRFED